MKISPRCFCIWAPTRYGMAHARACQDWQTRTRCMGNPGSASPSCSDIAGRVAGEGHGEEPKRDGMNDREQEERHRAPRIQGLDRKQYWLRRWTRLPVRFGRSTGNISCRVNSYFRGPHATFETLFVFFTSRNRQASTRSTVDQLVHHPATLNRNVCSTKG